MCRPATRPCHAYELALAGLRQPHVHWPLHLARAMLALLEGRFADNDRHIADVVRLCDQVDDFTARQSLLFHSAAGLRLRDRHHEMTASLVPHLASQPQANLDLYAAAVHAATGDLSAAREHMAQLSGKPDAQVSILAGVVADVGAALHDAEWGARLERILAPHADGCYGFGTLGMVVEGPVARPLALCRLAQGDPAGARRWFARAANRARALGARPILARTLVEWAEISAGGERTRLAAEALEIATALGLERLAARARAMTAPSASPMLVRDGDDWILTGCGESCRLRDSRGLHLLAQLIAAPGRELHVLDLAASGSPVDIGDAGAALDDQARVSYRARVKELRQAIDDAEARGDAARAVRAEAELAAVAAELSRAVGLGGRGRRVGLAAERARVNVQRRIADALRRIAEQAPGLGRHFGRAIRTGVYCSYLPERAATTKTPTTDSAGS